MPRDKWGQGRWMESIWGCYRLGISRAAGAMPGNAPVYKSSLAGVTKESDDLDQHQRLYHHALSKFYPKTLLVFGRKLQMTLVEEGLVAAGLPCCTLSKHQSFPQPQPVFPDSKLQLSQGRQWVCSYVRWLNTQPEAMAHIWPILNHKMWKQPSARKYVLYFQEQGGPSSPVIYHPRCQEEK